MNDLGQHCYERREYFFNAFTVHQIIINPQVKGYPAIFLVCRDVRGGVEGEYVVGTSFVQINRLLMDCVPNGPRIEIAERLADAIISRRPSETIDLGSVLGCALEIKPLEATTRLRRFWSDPAGQDPLYYFQLVDYKKLSTPGRA
jgi:hypothetical protein